MLEIFEYSFMIRAFIAGLTIGIIAPLIGNFLVLRRYSLIADTLSHTALAGVAIGMITGIYPLLTALIVAVLASLAIEKLRTTQNLSGETILAMFLPAGLSIALIIMNLSNGLNINIFNYLFGSVSTVTSGDLWLIVSLGAVAVAVIIIFYKQLLYTAFNEESARVSGIQVGTVNIILIVTTAVIVSLALRIVGVLLISALMVIPVVSAMNVGKSFKQSLLLSVFFALLSVVTGLFLAFYLNLPAGAAIVIVSLALFGLVALVGKK